MPIDYEKIKSLIAIVEENGLTELTVEEDGFSVTVKAEPASAQTPAHPPAANPSTQVEVQPIEMVMGPLVESEFAAGAVGIPQVGRLVQITSPMIGVFYRKPSPDSPPFIEVGDEIEVGQTIGLIEAMKVFSEVPSEVGGRVVAIPAESTKLVHQGDVLVVVDVSQG
jgi:acetyl-CoA carboxylase biotin carboxyl carrier protein